LISKKRERERQIYMAHSSWWWGRMKWSVRIEITLT
jgi:hypothetical protein